MVSRTRERVFASFGAGRTERKITTNPPVVTVDPQDRIPDAKLWKRCVDVIKDPEKDHPLSITERDNSRFVPLNGERYSPDGSYQIMKNYLSEGFVNVTHLSVSTPSVGARALQLRARTNPSREEVSIPNFLYELKDLPGMIRDIGDFKRKLRKARSGLGAVRSVASDHLAIQFGWKPLIKDLADMLSFQEQVDKRIDELNRLYSRTGLKRRLRLMDESVVTSGNVTASSSIGVLIKVRKDTITRRRSWGTIRWIPTSVPPYNNRKDLGKTARNLVFGMQHRGVDAVQAWNMLPWSWLIDWFANLGDFLKAHRNAIPAQPTGPCNIMTLTETYETWTRIDSNMDFEGATGLRVLRTKERVQSSGSLSVTMPFITGRQWSILGALAIQRAR